MGKELVFKDSIRYEYHDDWLYPDDLADEDHLLDEFKLEFQARSFDPGDVVYDIGAFIGTVSIRLALLGGVVHAIEGSPLNASRLKKIFAPFRQITLHPIALGESNEVKTCHFNDCINCSKQTIQFARFDDLDIPMPKFVKMDIEGWESVALLYAKKLIAARPCWQIEWHQAPDYPYVKVSEGGFDPMEFLKQDYCIFKARYPLAESEPYLPKDMGMGFACYYVIPREKLHRFPMSSAI